MDNADLESFEDQLKYLYKCSLRGLKIYYAAKLDSFAHAIFRAKNSSFKVVCDGIKHITHTEIDDLNLETKVTEKVVEWRMFTYINSSRCLDCNYTDKTNYCFNWTAKGQHTSVRRPQVVKAYISEIFSDKVCSFHRELHVIKILEKEKDMALAKLQSVKRALDSYSRGPIVTGKQIGRAHV